MHSSSLCETKSGIEARQSKKKHKSHNNDPCEKKQNLSAPSIAGVRAITLAHHADKFLSPLWSQRETGQRKVPLISHQVYRKGHRMMTPSAQGKGRTFRRRRGGATECVPLTRFSRVWLCNPKDHSPPGSSIHGILQARILKWVAMPSSRGSSQPRDQTCIS